MSAKSEVAITDPIHVDDFVLMMRITDNRIVLQHRASNSPNGVIAAFQQQTLCTGIEMQSLANRNSRWS